MSANGVVLERWRVSEEDTVGGWCIVPESDPRTPAEGAKPFITLILTKEIAQHVVDLHNATLEVRWWS